jgi:hypothetical protein
MLVDHLLTIPHRPAPGLCPVNGIRDLVHWRAGRDWSNEFLHGLGQGGGFAYLRFNFADPPRQVYWGIASPRQHKYLAELFSAGCSEFENRSFKYSWKKALEAVDAGTPPVLGPLDMYHLHFYTQIYHQRHIPIHYLLLVGYDAENAYFHDTGMDEVQRVPLNDLEQAWDVNVPGLGKRNRLVILDIPQEIISTEALIRQSLLDECKMMLNPPVSMLGIPAMEKVSREIAYWPQELGKEVADRCLLQVREYLNSPPDLMGDHITAGRDIYIAFLKQAGKMVSLDFSAAIRQLDTAMNMLPDIVRAIQLDHLAAAASGFARVAAAEREAFTILFQYVGESVSLAASSSTSNS